MLTVEKIDLEPIKRMSKDIRAAADNLSDTEARYLVDTYYQMQEGRIRADHQIRSMKDTGEPNLVLQYLAENSGILENQIKGALGRYVRKHIVGDWLLSVKGIGDVLSAGLLAHIDIKKCPNAGTIWNYAGLNPDVEWLGNEKSKKIIQSVKDEMGIKGDKIKDKELVTLIEKSCNKMKRNSIHYYSSIGKSGSKNSLKEFSKWAAGRPFNASLKELCWKIGESFVKVSGKDDALYGRLYVQKKEQLIRENEELKFKEAANEKVKIVGKSTESYKYYSECKLPPAHIYARAKRYAVKIFLSHLHQVWYELHHGKPAPKPFAIAHLGHVHEIKPSK